MGGRIGRASVAESLRQDPTEDLTSETPGRGQLEGDSMLNFSIILVFHMGTIPLLSLA